MRFKILTVFFLCLICLFASCQKQEISGSYSLNGEDHRASLKNGSLVIRNNFAIFFGGELSFLEEKLIDIQSVTTEFAYAKNGKIVVVCHDTYYFSDVTEKDVVHLGRASFDIKDLDYLINNLTLKITGTLKSGHKFEYTLKIVLNKV